MHINILFEAAQSSGALSAASMPALTIADIGAMIQARRATAQNDASQIRRAFQVFSPSAVRASQSAVQFGQTVPGGFGAP